jgi:endonuclease YncB( thermonuclease family)
MTRYFVRVFLLITLISSSVEASTLFGQVTEINGGDVITVFNLNRPVRIRLLAVDAPEDDQAFGDVAKKHLSDLVYEKAVVVEYWGIAADGSLVGRVLLNNADIGAQMIRDGAAWFDPNNQGRLSVADRAIYQQSELAARNERRGLWQAEAPVAPWEFVKARALRLDTVASLNSVLPTAKSRANRPTPELTSTMLFSSRVGSTLSPSGSTSPASDAQPFDTQIEEALWGGDEGARKEWGSYKPEGENFSALVPKDGFHKQVTLPIGPQEGTLNIYVAREGQTVYALMWIAGPSFGESDRSALSSSAQGFLYGFAAGYRRRNNAEFSCEPKGERQVFAGGFSGSEYDLPSCTIPTKVRMYTRVVDGQRRMYIAAVFYEEADKNVSRFIKSFTVTSSTNTEKQ